MAAPIVRTFVIDTSAAEQNLQQLNVGINATTASLDAMYAQLVSLDTQLQNLDPNTQAFTDVNAQIKTLETTITQIETGKIDEIGSALQNIDAGDAAKSIEKVGDAVEQAVAPVTQLATATDQLNAELKDTKVDTSSIETASTDFKELAVEEENVVASSKSLKAQLRELQAELANTEPDSTKYRELSQEAGILKDKIQDAAQAVGTQAGGAFERVGGSLGLVTSRIASLDFEGAAEGAKLLAQNIGDIKPGDITKGIKGIGSALGAVGKALLTNPIFLIGAAIALAVVYSKELLSLIDGVTDADQALLEIQKEKTAQAKQQFDAIGQQEESLKRQGFTEEEILQKKLEALDFAILTAKVTAETTEAQAQGQIDAAKRNKEILEGLLNFVSLPLTALLAGVDLLTEGLNKAGFITDETFAKVGNLRNKFTDSVSNLLFDPAKVEKETKEATEAAKKGVTDLENTRDGLLNARDAKNKAAAKKAADDAKAEADAKLKIAQDLAKEEEALFDDLLKSFEEHEQERTKAAQDEAAKRLALSDNYYNELAALQNQNLLDSLSDNEKEELAVKEKYAKLLAAAEAFNASLKPGEEAQAIDVVAIEKQQGEEVNAVKQANADEAAAIALTEEEKKRQEQLATVNQGIELAQGAVNAIQGISDAAFANKLAKVKKGSKEEEALFKKQFQLNKKLQLAGATMDAAKAVTASIAAAPLAILAVPNPVGIASAAFAAATGLASIAKIAATKYESPGSSSSSPPPSIGGGGGGDTGSQPAQFNPLASSFLQDRPDQVTPRAYVLAGDVASQQEVRTKVEDLSRIG
jgi:hypothetical protein